MHTTRTLVDGLPCGTWTQGLCVRRCGGVRGAEPPVTVFKAVFQRGDSAENRFSAPRCLQPKSSSTSIRGMERQVMHTTNMSNVSSTTAASQTISVRG